MTPEIIINAILIGLAGLMIVSFLLHLAFEDSEWPFWVFVAICILVVLAFVAMAIFHELGLLYIELCLPI